MAITDDQQRLLDAIHGALAADTDIEAAWLAGSLGRGGGDAYSDVDVLALVGGRPATEVGLRYARDAAAIAEPVLVTPLYGGRVINVVTADWGRFDISFVEPAELVRHDAGKLTVLFNRGEQAPPTRPARAYRPAPETVLALVNEYLRVLGLLVLGVGRGEWVLSLSGHDILRRLILDLMLEENGVAPGDRGGVLSRYKLLTPEQLAELRALSPVVADREGVIAANIELAAIFLPRARRLAGQIGLEWPEAFEAATRRHLRDRLGVELA